MQKKSFFQIISAKGGEKSAKGGQFYIKGSIVFRISNNK